MPSSRAAVARRVLRSRRVDDEHRIDERLDLVIYLLWIAILLVLGKDL